MSTTLSDPRGGKNQIDSMEALVQILAHPDIGLAELRRSVRKGELASWFKTVPELNDSLNAKISSLFDRLSSNPALLLFALRYTLTPNAPLEIGHGMWVRGPTELAAPLLAAWREDKQAFAGLRCLVENGHFEEWLTAIEAPAWKDRLRAIQTIRIDYPKERDLPGWLMLWAYSPNSPFPFVDYLIETPKDLARAIDASDDARQEGLALLDQCWIRTWLMTTNHLHNVADWDKDVQDACTTPQVRLGLLLHYLDPDRPAPPTMEEQAQQETEQTPPKLRQRSTFSIAKKVWVGLLIGLILVLFIVILPPTKSPVSRLASQSQSNLIFSNPIQPKNPRGSVPQRLTEGTPKASGITDGLNQNNVPPPAQIGEIAYVDTILLNVRTGPGMTYASGTTIPSGTAVRILERRTVEDGTMWVRIEAPGATGWVNISKLSSRPGAPNNPPLLQPSPTTPVMINTGAGVYLRSAPDRRASKRILLSFGKVVTVLERQIQSGESWCRVSTTEGEEGWMPVRFLVDFQRENALPTYLRIGRDKLASTNQFGDLVEVGNFLATVRADIQDPRGANDLRRLMLQAWRKTYTVIPSARRNYFPYHEWIEEHTGQPGWNEAIDLARYLR